MDYYDTLDQFQRAIKNGNLQTVIKLYKDIKNIDFDMFKIAISNNHIDIVKFLYEKTNLNNNKDNLTNGLITACIYYNDEIIKYLIRKGANITPNALKWVVNNGKIKMVKYLIEKGASSAAPADLSSTF